MRLLQALASTRAASPIPPPAALMAHSTTPPPLPLPLPQGCAPTMGLADTNGDGVVGEGDSVKYCQKGACTTLPFADGGPRGEGSIAGSSRGMLGALRWW